MKLNNQERKTLEQIKIYYEEIERLFDNINDLKKEEIFKSHLGGVNNRTATLQYCNGRGLQAVTEILQISKGEKNE